MTTRRKAWISIAAVLTVLTMCTAYLVVGVLQLSVGRDDPRVQVDLPVTGGLFVGSNASYRGVVVGKVVAMHLGPEGVEATVRLRAGTRIPVDSAAEVRSLSPVGEQYLDFQPRSETGPFLEDGARVTAAAVSVPETVAGLAGSLDRLIDQIDTSQLRVLLDELDTGLAGASDDVQRLLADTSRIVKTLDDDVDVFVRLVDDGHVVLRLGAQSSQDLRKATSSYAEFVSWLRANLPLVTDLLDDAPDRIATLRGLLKDLGRQAPAFLKGQAELDGLLAAHDPHLRALLSEYPAAVDAFASSFRDGSIQFDLLLRRGELCRYVTQPRGAHDTTYRELQDQGRCSTAETEIAQRGAQFAPGPVPVRSQ